MIHKSNWPSPLRNSAIAAAALGLATIACGNQNIRNAWITRYGGVSSSYANLANGCTLCHATAGGSNWNAYGWNIRQQIHSGAAFDQAFTNVEHMNSDSMSVENLAEILASAQPGWTAGANNTYFFTSSTTPNQMPAALLAGAYDPVVVLPCPADIAPPGGNHFVNVDDLLATINAWGACANPNDCPADIAPLGGNDFVNVDDLLAVINAWGPCP